MYKIKKEAFFYTNPHDFQKGLPSDKTKSETAVIMLKCYKYIDRRQLKWNSVALVKKSNFSTKSQIENALCALPFDIPFIVRQTIDDKRATEDIKVFNNIPQETYSYEMGNLLEGTKRFELVIPKDVVGTYVGYDGREGNFSNEMQTIISTLAGLGFNPLIRVSHYGRPGDFYYESKNIKYQINADNLSSFKDFLGKEIKPGDKVAWAESKKQIITGKVVEIFSDKVKINTEMGWAGSGFRDINFALKEYSFIKL